MKKEVSGTALRGLKRVDVHRPSVIEPSDYRFVACEYIRVDDISDAHFLMAERARLRAHMQETGGTYSSHDHGGNCHICGSVNAIYTVLFYHAKTNTYVRTGLDCAEKLDFGGGEAFRHRCVSALEQVAGKKKARAVLEREGLSAAWAVYEIDVLPGNDLPREETVVRDIVSKLIQYGSMSEAQTGLVRNLLHNIEHRAEIQAQRAAEREAAAPLPSTEGRVKVCGRVLSIRVPDYRRGECGPTKMLVQASDGWKVWGSLPRGLDADVGDLIEFCAKIKASKNDAKFGYFSRPTKATKAGVQ